MKSGTSARSANGRVTTVFGCLAIAGGVALHQRSAADARPQEPGVAGSAEQEAAAGASDERPARGFEQAIPGTTVRFRMLPIPGGELRWREDREERTARVAPFHMAEFEVTWDMYDVCVFRLDERPEGGTGDAAVDAISRPTKPYISVDRGFGHNGFPALSISHGAAQTYCEWLSRKTGRRYRLPTREEWMWAALAGAEGPYACEAEELDAYAWSKENSDRRTHAAGEKLPNAWGLHDMHGNVAEWVSSSDGRGRLVGGHYKDRAGRLDVTDVREPQAAWNATDPQIPKSVWWLADAPWAGFRLVCDEAPANPGEPEAPPLEEDRR